MPERGNPLSLDGQLCLDLNRIARAAPTLRDGVVLVSQYVAPAATVPLVLASGLRRDAHHGLGRGLPLLLGVLAGGVAVALASLIGVRATPVPPADLLVHPSVLMSLPDARCAAVVAVALGLAVRAERLAALAAALLAVVAGLADIATGAVAPSSAIAGLALGCLLAGLVPAAVTLAGRRGAAHSPLGLAPRLQSTPTIAPEGPAAHREPLAGTGSVRLLAVHEGREAAPAPRRLAPAITADATDRLPAAVRLLPRAAGDDTSS
jgi:hypothetical protein